jgi:hypothetical protein
VVAVLALPVKSPVNDVDVTEANPVSMVAVVPKDIDVDPIVTELFARFTFVIPAVPLKFAFVNPVIVFDPAAIVLFVNVSAPFSVASVPVTGNVTFVGPVVVSVRSFAGVVVKAPPVVILPPRVIVFAPLSTPVPPYWPVIIPPFHVPVDTVPNVVIVFCPT